MDFNDSISRTFRILFHRIATLVSCANLGFSVIELLRYYLAQIKDSLSLDCYVSISLTFRILFRRIATLVSCTN